LQSNRPEGPKIGASSRAARITLAKAAISGDSRDCEFHEIPRLLADMQPALQAGCLFVGFDYSVMVAGRGAIKAPQHEIVPGF